MQCYGQHHFAASNDLHEHLRRHSLLKDSVKMNYSKMRPESSECTSKAKAILIHLERNREECAQEVWERHRMSLDMHITWWNVKNRKLMEMILLVFREQSEEDGQMNTVKKLVVFNTRNLGRMGTNFERARRILGMRTRQKFTEDTVLIASSDSCKW